MRAALKKISPWNLIGIIRRTKPKNLDHRDFFYEKERHSHQVKNLSIRAANKQHGYGIR
jgi:hypothetical protein